MKQELTFLCLGCGRTTTEQLTKARVLNAVVRCYFAPKGWAILYPPQDFPTRSGICNNCIAKAREQATPK